MTVEFLCHFFDYNIGAKVFFREEGRILGRRCSLLSLLVKLSFDLLRHPGLVLIIYSTNSSLFVT